MSNKYEDLIKNARVNAECGEHMSPTEVTTLLNVVETTFAALAAENAGLKAALNPEVIPDTAVESFNETAVIDHDWNDTSEWSWVENDTDVIRAVLEAITPETTATDAFLAEMRAQGLNAFIQHHSAGLDAHIKNGGEQFDEKSVRIRDIIVSARLFREQIRKEAAQ